MAKPQRVPCKSVFSNGTEHELFEETQCFKCSRYRKGKCRINTAILKAMFDNSFFPYNDLYDWSDGYGGKTCKSFTDKPLKRKNRQRKEIPGQQIIKCERG